MSETSTVSALRATAHPVRLRILSLLTGSALSAAEIARELDISHANASYHLRVLADVGAVVEAGEEKIRGGVAKRYRHPWDDYRATHGTAVAPEDGQVYVRAMAEELVRRFTERAPGTPAVTTDAEMWVTPEVWEEVRSMVQEASVMLHREARPPRTDGTLHVNLTAAAFQLTPAPEPGETAPRPADPSLIQQDSRRVARDVTGR
jgi:DNA-binding transcriptional ArsR family regulator